MIVEEIDPNGKISLSPADPTQVGGSEGDADEADDDGPPRRDRGRDRDRGGSGNGTRRSRTPVAAAVPAGGGADAPAAAADGDDEGGAASAPSGTAREDVSFGEHFEQIAKDVYGDLGPELEQSGRGSGRRRSRR